MAKFIVVKKREHDKRSKKAMTFRLSPQAIKQLKLIAREMHWTLTYTL